MEFKSEPQLSLAQKNLPAPLYEVLTFLFKRPLSGCALVGGTALSGFYTAHRRSDDIDIFTNSEINHKTALLAAANLKNHSIYFHKETTTAYYYHANCIYKNHNFTLDIVLDPHLFLVGEGLTTEQHITVASLRTLFQMKAAALVSRASEKDLYDLKILFSLFKNTSISEFIELGKSIDAGVNAESMLASLGGAYLRSSACDFSLSADISSEFIYKEILQLRKTLIKEIQLYLKSQPTLPLGELVRYARKILK